MEQGRSLSPSPFLSRSLVGGGERADKDVQQIAKFFRGKTFMSAPWLFAEAYQYRRLHEAFTLSRYWTTYDVFFRQSKSLSRFELKALIES